MRTGSNPDRIQIDSPAKVNFFLEILGRREDGFHELETVMSTVSLYDSLEFRLTQPGASDELHLTKPDPSIPTGPENLVLRAIQLCRQASCREDLRGIAVLLNKRIPSAAGLGGASGNAAAAVAAANLLWDLEISEKAQHEILAELGSDVPFFATGGAAICRGRGESVSTLKLAAGIPIVIATPPVGLSTAKVYSLVELPESTVPSPWNEDLAAQQIDFGKMFNRLEQFADSLTSWVARLREEFRKVQPLGHQLSGSGSSYFGVFRTVHEANIAASKLTARLPQVEVFSVSTTDQSLSASLRPTAALAME